MTENAPDEKKSPQPRGCAVALVAAVAVFIGWVAIPFGLQVARDRSTAAELAELCNSVAEEPSPEVLLRRFTSAAERDDALHLYDSRVDDVGTSLRKGDLPAYEVILRNEPTAYLRARCSFIADGASLRQPASYMAYWK